MPFHTALRTLRLPWGKLAYRLRLAAPEPAALTGAPFVVCLHGLGGDHEDWREVAENLPATWHMALMDFRGHGRSAAPEEGFGLDDLARDLLEWLQHLAPGPVHLIGYGVGGMVALRATALAASAVPDRSPGVAIHGLVLMETFSSLSASAAFRPGRFQPQLSADRRHAITAKYRATRERFHVAYYDQFWASVIQFDAQPLLHSTLLPVHAIYGGAGRHGGTPEKLRLPDRANLRLHWVENAGHYLLHEKPAEVAQLCRRCIETVRLPDAPAVN